MDARGSGRARLVGDALGGLAGLNLAACAPDRVAKAAVVNAWVRLDPCTARCFDVRQRILRDSGPRAYLEAQPLFLYPPTWISENSARIVRDIEAQLEHFQGIATLERRIGAARGFDMAERVPDISVPVLAIAAQDDMLVPWTATDRMTADTSLVELALKPSGGHAYNVTMPGDFNHTIFGWLPS
jgi:aminoacrylate hydrolase